MRYICVRLLNQCCSLDASVFNHTHMPSSNQHSKDNSFIHVNAVDVLIALINTIHCRVSIQPILDRQAAHMHAVASYSPERILYIHLV